jgi:hypothetical protein
MEVEKKKNSQVSSDSVRRQEIRATTIFVRFPIIFIWKPNGASFFARRLDPGTRRFRARIRGGRKKNPVFRARIRGGKSKNTGFRARI